MPEKTRKPLFLCPYPGVALENHPNYEFVTQGRQSDGAGIRERKTINYRRHVETRRKLQYNRLLCKIPSSSFNDYAYKNGRMRFGTTLRSFPDDSPTY